MSGIMKKIYLSNLLILLRDFPPLSLLLIFLIISVTFLYKRPVRGLGVWLSYHTPQKLGTVIHAYHSSTQEVEEDQKFEVIFNSVSTLRSTWAA